MTAVLFVQRVARATFVNITTPTIRDLSLGIPI
jgi:hypothetical protein